MKDSKSGRVTVTGRTRDLKKEKEGKKERQIEERGHTLLALSTAQG